MKVMTVSPPTALAASRAGCGGAEQCFAKPRLRPREGEEGLRQGSGLDSTLRRREKEILDCSDKGRCSCCQRQRHSARCTGSRRRDRLARRQPSAQLLSNHELRRESTVTFVRFEKLHAAENPFVLHAAASRCQPEPPPLPPRTRLRPVPSARSATAARVRARSEPVVPPLMRQSGIPGRGVASGACRPPHLDDVLRQHRQAGLVAQGHADVGQPAHQQTLGAADVGQGLGQGSQVKAPSCQSLACQIPRCPMFTVSSRWLSDPIDEDHTRQARLLQMLLPVRTRALPTNDLARRFVDH